MEIDPVRLAAVTSFIRRACFKVPDAWKEDVASEVLLHVLKMIGNRPDASVFRCVINKRNDCLRRLRVRNATASMGGADCDMDQTNAATDETSSSDPVRGSLTHEDFTTIYRAARRMTLVQLKFLRHFMHEYLTDPKGALVRACRLCGFTHIRGGMVQDAIRGKLADAAKEDASVKYRVTVRSYTELRKRLFQLMHFARRKARAAEVAAVVRRKEKEDRLLNRRRKDRRGRPPRSR